MRAHRELIDVGEMGDRLFFNVAGVGLDAHVAALVSTRVHHRGLVPYLAASFGDLVQYTWQANTQSSSRIEQSR